jgi:hypothetical protein
MFTGNVKGFAGRAVVLAYPARYRVIRSNPNSHPGLFEVHQT